MRGLCPVCEKPLYYATNPTGANPDRACSDPECVNAHGIVDHGLPEPRYRIGLDLALDAPPAVTVVKELPDGGFEMIDPDREPLTYSTIIQDIVHARLREQHERHEAFLREVLRVSDHEYRALMGNLQAGLFSNGVIVGSRGHGKRLRAEVTQRLIDRMNERGLPENFWGMVAAYNMLTDEEGRRLVKMIIDKKVGCDHGSATDR